MAQFDVLTIGNAIVDVIARTDDDFLVNNGIIKGAMNLIDATRAELLYSRMGQTVETSGGSAGNTASGVASLGGKAAYMGKVANDHLGQVFAHDMRGQGVAYDTRPLEGGAPTARCMIFNTPDGERSMNTYLGACVEFGPEDVEVSKVAEAKVVYFEGYLWDPPRAKEAMRLAAKIAHENGNEMAITLSDSFCVDRYRDEFLELIRTGTVDIVFANEAELLSLYETSSFDMAMTAIRNDVRGFACVTLGEKGSVVMRRNETFSVKAYPVDEVVDQTGAGDVYAAGFLYGYTNGLSFEDSARLGSLCASTIIQQVGPRAQFSLRDLGVQAGLIQPE
ncbi:adenosine kinase [Bartonella sp. LJL80]